jgi:hypothetical protein
VLLPAPPDPLAMCHLTAVMPQKRLKQVNLPALQAENLLAPGLTTAPMEWEPQKEEREPQKEKRTGTQVSLLALL